MEANGTIQPANRRFMLSSMYFFLINGMILLMTSSLLVYLMREYGLSYRQGGFLLTVQAVGSLITNYLSSPLSVRIGSKNTLILTAAGFFIGVCIITITPPLPVLYTGLFITGLSWGCSNNLINFLLVRETGGDSGRIAAVHTSFSVGAFIAPLLVALTVASDISWRWASGFISLMAFTLIIVTIYMPVRESARQ
ncbi:MAG: MFS transporter, partial [Saccharofermentanales bacterium]